MSSTKEKMIKKQKRQQLKQAQDNLYYFMNAGDLKEIKQILDTYPNLANSNDLSAKADSIPRPLPIFYALNLLFDENFNNNTANLKRRYNVLDFLIANPKTKLIDNSNGKTVLHPAAQMHAVPGFVNKGLVVLQHLLKSPKIQALINNQNIEESTALSLSLIDQDNEKIALLLSNKADLFYRGKNGINFLHDILNHAYSETEALKLIQTLQLEKYDLPTIIKNIFEQPTISESPFNLAITKGYVQCVTWMFKMKKDFGLSEKVFQEALHTAALQGNAIIVQFLLDNKADVNALNDQGLTALDLINIQLATTLSPVEPLNPSTEMPNSKKLSPESFPGRFQGLTREQKSSSEQTTTLTKIAELLRKRGAVAVPIQTFPVPSGLNDLAYELRQESKLSLDNVPKLTANEETKIRNDQKIIKELHSSKLVKNYVCSTAEELKEARSKHPNAYVCIEPQKPVATHEMQEAILFKDLEAKQIKELEHLQQLIDEANEKLEEFLEDFIKPTLFVQAATNAEVLAAQNKGHKNILLGFKWFGNYRSMRAFKKLDSTQKKLLPEMQNYIDSCSEKLMTSWQDVLKRYKTLRSDSDKFYDKEQWPGIYSFKEDVRKRMSKATTSNYFILTSPFYSDCYQELTIYEKLKPEQQKILDKIQANVRPILLRNRLGYDLLHFTMSGVLKQVSLDSIRASLEHDIKQQLEELSNLKAKPLDFSDEKEKKEFQDHLKLWEHSLKNLLARRVERHSELTRLNSKKAGKSIFDQNINQYITEDGVLNCKIGNNNLTLVDLRKRDYLFLTNTMPATPNYLGQVVKSLALLFHDESPSMSCSLMGPDTRGFAFGHNEPFMFPLLSIISKTTNYDPHYIGPTDLGSPYACRATRKFMYLNSTDIVRDSMDLLLATFQMKVLENDKTRITPDCPGAVLKALEVHAELHSKLMEKKERKDSKESESNTKMSDIADIKEENELKDSRELSAESSFKMYTYKVPEPSTDDHESDTIKANSRWMGRMPRLPLESILNLTRYDANKKDSYAEAIITCNMMNPKTSKTNDSKIKIKLLAVEEFFFTKFINDYNNNYTSWSLEFRQAVDQSLNILANISRLTNGKVKFALIKTNMDGWKAKYPVATQVQNLQTELQMLSPNLTKLATQVSRAKQAMPKVPQNLLEKFQRAQLQYRLLTEQAVDFEHLVHGRNAPSLSLTPTATLNTTLNPSINAAAPFLPSKSGSGSGSSRFTNTQQTRLHESDKGDRKYQS